MREAMVRAGYRPAQLAVVPNPVTVHTDSRVQAENNHGFLYLGRLEETKGPDLACAAARAAGVPLLLAGTGALMDPLRAQYPEFEFLGAIPRSDVPQVMQRARCLLMPSRYPEPYGMVATEALWSGVPVICSDTALLANQIEAIEAGFGCPPRDVVRFSALLRELARDDLLVRRMSLNAVSRSREMGLTLSRWLDACQFQYTQCLTPDPQNATARDVAPEQAAS
jgi:glycosyltransferase involved in cell wall biosynthesis